MTQLDPQNGARPGHGTGAGQESAGRLDHPKSTPGLARRSWNGHPSLLTDYWHRDLRRAGRHPDALALAIFDALGPKRSRAVAYELLGLSQEWAS